MQEQQRAKAEADRRAREKVQQRNAAKKRRLTEVNALWRDVSSEPDEEQRARSAHRTKRTRVRLDSEAQRDSTQVQPISAAPESDSSGSDSESDMDSPILPLVSLSDSDSESDMHCPILPLVSQPPPAVRIALLRTADVQQHTFDSHSSFYLARRAVHSIALQQPPRWRCSRGTECEV
jgi:hypothetical protein